MSRADNGEYPRMAPEPKPCAACGRDEGDAIHVAPEDFDGPLVALMDMTLTQLAAHRLKKHVYARPVMGL